MLLRSPRGAFSSTWAAASFSEGTLSPVRGRLLAFQTGAFQKPGIGGDKVPGLQANDVARHQLGRVNHLLPSIPKHPGVRGGHVLQGVQGLFRLGLLHHAQHGV